MKNLTISIDAQTLEWARVRAARRGVSMSRFVAELLAERQRHDARYETAMRRALSREPMVLNANGPTTYPTREERHERGLLR